MCGILTTFEVAVQTICPDRRHPISLDGGCDTYVAANKGSVEGLLLNYFCILFPTTHKKRPECPAMTPIKKGPECPAMTPIKKGPERPAMTPF